MRKTQSDRRLATCLGKTLYQYRLQACIADRMQLRPTLMKTVHSYFVVIACYVLCHGLVELVVGPLQSMGIPRVTTFASILYLPHGVRVLASWLMGWQAVIPLYAGALIAHLVFQPASMISHLDILDPIFLVSVGIGATAAVAGFEVLRLAGLNLYAAPYRRVKWLGILLVGVIASLINALGQSVAFSGIVSPKIALEVFWTYVLGDTFGLIATMIVLAITFRLMRGRRRGNRG